MNSIFANNQAQNNNYGAAVCGLQQSVPPPTLSSHIECLDARISQATEVLGFANKVSDQLVGSVPRAVGDAKGAPESNNMLDRLRAREQRLQFILQEIHSELSRISNAI